MLIVTGRGLVHPKWIDVIEKRDLLLKEADNLVNVALDNNIDTAPFRSYRQQLRDLPQSNQDPYAINWPQKPEINLNTQ
ncbi:hypothetical protein HB762_28005 (plasmid) [Vibrio campbellii]|uniref:Phage tail assembly chaperone-like domain-containing protein n=2 Tax=Vibrio campbellii TaxID=680 RepID=A0ABY5IQ67_9VIBR|nr:hypothetical protein HB762_28005 [Vibrio campbellii]